MATDDNVLTGAGLAARPDFRLTLTATSASTGLARQMQSRAECNPALPFDVGSPSSAGAAIANPLGRQLAPFVATES